MTIDPTLEQMMRAALKIGKVEWGATRELPAESHGEHVVRSVENTAKSFGQTGPQSMHGLYTRGDDIVLAHTGTSPNSPTHARILTALWNNFVDQATSALGDEVGQ